MAYGENMITISLVKKKIENIRSLHENTLRRYVYELLEVLEDSELKKIIEDFEIDYGVRRKSRKILELRERGNDVY